MTNMSKEYIMKDTQFLSFDEALKIEREASRLQGETIAKYAKLFASRLSSGVRRAFADRHAYAGDFGGK
jgi:hypothetical protein